MEINSSFGCRVATVPGYERAWMQHPRHVQLEAWMHAAHMFTSDLYRHFPSVCGVYFSTCSFFFHAAC